MGLAQTRGELVSPAELHEGLAVFCPGPRARSTSSITVPRPGAFFWENWRSSNAVLCKMPAGHFGVGGQQETQITCLPSLWGPHQLRGWDHPSLVALPRALPRPCSGRNLMSKLSLVGCSLGHGGVLCCQQELLSLVAHCLVSASLWLSFFPPGFQDAHYPGAFSQGQAFRRAFPSPIAALLV